MKTKKTYKLLLVDDDQLIRMVYQHAFARDFDMVIAGSGKEALNLLREQNFDAILTDIEMPEMSGIELTKAVRNSGMDINKTLILGLTAAPDVVKEEAKNAGMKVVFAKPIELEKLSSYLQENLR